MTDADLHHWLEELVGPQHNIEELIKARKSIDFSDGPLTRTAYWIGEAEDESETVH
jgi:hypothetical protein